MIDTVIIEVPNPNHPYGVRGVGEVPIAAAGRHRQRHCACGGRASELPVAPTRFVGHSRKDGADSQAPVDGRRASRNGDGVDAIGRPGELTSERSERFISGVWRLGRFVAERG